MTITAEDDFGAASVITFELIVENVAPDVTVGSNPVVVNEGDVAINAGDFFDPGTLDVVTISASVGEIVQQPGNFGTWNWSFLTRDESDSQSVTITATDDIGHSTSMQFALIVQNVAPIVTLNGPSIVDEGAVETYFYSWFDPGLLDTFELVSEPSCGTAALQFYSFDEITRTGSIVCQFGDGPDNSLVSIQIREVGGADSNIASIDVEIGNEPPIVELSGETEVDEGSTVTYTITTFDPNANDTFSLEEPTCGSNGVLGNVVFDPSTGNGSLDCTFGNGTDVSGVLFRISDSGGNFDVGAAFINIRNVAPVVTISGPNNVNVGDTETYTFTTVDPGIGSAGAFEIYTLAGNCGDNGIMSNQQFLNVAATGSFDCTFFDGPSTTVVQGAVGDDEELSNVAQITVTINAPILSVDNAEISVAPGETATNSGSFDTTSGIASIVASIGEIVMSAGTWVWNLPAEVIPAFGAPVTVTALDADGVPISEVIFQLVVAVIFI